MSEPWRNRIVGHREVDPQELQRHPLNWRTHPEAQAAGLRATLERVGVVQDVIVSKATGRILDGHLRVDAAIATGQNSIPIVEVDVTEEEERLVLATFDALGGMAEVNAEALQGLLGQVEAFVPGPEIAGVFEALRERSGLSVEEVDFPELPDAADHSVIRMTFLLTDVQAETVKEAVAKARRAVGAVGEDQNRNGEALFALCTAYLAAE